MITKKLCLVILTPLLIVVGVLCGWWYFYPLEAIELSDQYPFWKAGIQDFQSGQMHAYLNDHCPSKTNDAGCSCVVLVHGLADNAKTWKKILLWPEPGWKQYGISKPLKIVAVDLPGSGKTPAPTDQARYRVRTQASELRDFLKPLCKKWIVVGNSLGGWVSAWLALDWPEGVSRLILLDPAGLSEKTGNTTALLREPTVESMKEFQKRAYSNPKPVPEYVWKAIVDRTKQSNARQVIAAQTEEDFLDQRLSSINSPTLLFWGKQDQVFPASVKERFRALLSPAALWREVDQCGHLPQKECPLDVIQAIADMAKYGAM